MTHTESTQQEKDPQNIEREAAFRVLEFAEAGMRKEAPVLLRMLQKRHEIFHMDSSDFSSDLSLEEQLYDDAFYNDAFYVKDLRVRTGAEYEKLKESYDPVLNTTDKDGVPTPENDDTPEDLMNKLLFRRSVMTGAQELGYISTYAGVSENEIDRRLNILPSTLEPVGEVKAVVILGAAGVSNPIRVRDTFRNIESGAVETDTIIFAAGERTALQRESDALEKLGLNPGKTEFEQAINALEDIGHVHFEEETEKHPATYGEDIPDNSVRRGTVVVNDKVINVVVVEGTYDRNRKDVMSGKLADRSITSETMQAIIPFLPKGDKPLLIESHDGWAKGQEIIAQEILGLEAQEKILLALAYKSDRIKVDENGELDIVAAQAIIDEMAKSYFNFVRLKIAALNKLKSLGVTI